tara:strand:+ start:6604 stop:7428 length:825 start_codon:yes stop_codon:yes gene_type:complete
MTTNQTIYQVDAFTNSAFKGNPAGVMFIDSSFTEENMQLLATEMNLSETAFITKKGDDFSIRYFTPTTEIPLCGHATLASAHIIWESGLRKKEESITFQALNDTLTIENNEGWITMSFPKYKIHTTAIPNNFESIIGFTPLEVYAADYGWKIAIASTEEDIAKAFPNFEEMTKHELGLLMITSKSDRNEVDFVVRCFAPQSGINEDPVTGSAQCGLVPVWNLITKKTVFSCEQISERTGELKVALVDNRVLISGQAITIFKAELHNYPSITQLL